MTRTKRAAAALLLAAGLVGGATACSSTPVEPALAATTASPTPTASPTSVVETRAYTMADGTTVDVDPTQPLPAAVLADISAPTIAAVAKIIPFDTTSYNGVEHPISVAATAATESAAAAAQQTHRQVLIVFRVWDGMKNAWVWCATRGSDKEGIPDKAARVAEVQAYIAASVNPAEYDLIILD